MVGPGVAEGPSIGCAWFELFLLLLMAVGVALLGEAILVSVWSARAAPALFGLAVPPALLVGMGGKNSGSYEWKATRKRTRSALVAAAIVLLTLVTNLGKVQSRGLAMGRGVRKGPSLQQFYERRPIVQDSLISCHS